MDVLEELVVWEEAGLWAISGLWKNPEDSLYFVRFEDLSTRSQKVIDITGNKLRFLVPINHRKSLLRIRKINLIELKPDLLQLSVHSYLMLKVFRKQVFQINLKPFIRRIILSRKDLLYQPRILPRQNLCPELFHSNHPDPVLVEVPKDHVKLLLAWVDLVLKHELAEVWWNQVTLLVHVQSLKNSLVLRELVTGDVQADWLSDRLEMVAADHVICQEVSECVHASWILFG